VAIEFAGDQLRAVGLLQRERRDGAGLWEQLDHLRRRLLGCCVAAEVALRCDQAESAGQRGQHDDEDGAVEHRGP
jgi:hypothetical protein